MDYVKPTELVSEALLAAEKKASLSTRDMLLRGFLAGGLLAYATSLSQLIWAQGTPRIVGAVAFPVGFVILTLLGLELATGNFALLPKGVAAGRVRVGALLRNWGWVYAGNFVGSVSYALLFYWATTSFGTSDGGALAAEVRHIAEKKTLAYGAAGASGLATALVKGILCNWMVTLGTVLAYVSRSTIGKIVAMWLPIMTFFALGYEHSIVNMYAIPAGMLFGAPISLGDWWLWNQIPVTIGNILGGGLLTGLALWATYGEPA